MSHQHISTTEALKLIEQLQLFVVQRNEAIESLCEQIQSLQRERDDLRDEVESLRSENEGLKKFCPEIAKNSFQSIRPQEDMSTYDVVTTRNSTLQITVTSTSTSSADSIMGTLPQTPSKTETTRTIEPASQNTGMTTPQLVHKKTQSFQTNIHQQTPSPTLSGQFLFDNRPSQNYEIKLERETSSKGESTSYHTVDEKRTEKDVNGNNWAATVCRSPAVSGSSSPIVPSPSKKSIQRSGSKRTHRRDGSRSIQEYQLSSDLRDKKLELLEKKYGGKEKANNAALVIQQHYRHWVMGRSFHRIRAFSERKKSITRMPERHFEKLKQTSLVFYGPENPVMIVDIDPAEKDVSDGLQVADEKPSSKKFDEKLTPKKYDDKGYDVKNMDEIVIDANIRIPSHSSEDTENDGDVELSSDESSVAEGDDSKVDIGKTDDVEGVSQLENDEKKGYEEVAVELGDTGVKKVNSSPNETEHQQNGEYEIIDESNVMTVIGKHVDLDNGTSLEVDRIYGDSDDATSIGGDSLYMTEGGENYEPTFDKSMHKRQFRIGVNLFNWKPEVGIQYLIDNGHLESDEESIAEFFRRETTVSKQKISEYLGTLRNEFNMKVLRAFTRTFHFYEKGVDEALRQFQSYFKLTGEAQTVEKFLMMFSERYVECNPDKVSNNPDTILILAFALAMLNTDLHNQNVKRRMTVEQFIRNLRGTDDGNDLPEDELRQMYNRIQKNEFSTGADHTTQLQQIENSFFGKVPNIAASHRQFVKLFNIEEVHDPNKNDKVTHRRLAFLFNDLLLLAKPRPRAGAPGGHAGQMFSCKASYSLLDKRVAEFSTEFYPNGVCLLHKMDKNKVVASFNTKDEKTRRQFIEELDEYIRETNGIENIRMALSKAKQLSWHNFSRKDDRTKSLVFADRKERGSMMDKAETTSLMDLRMESTLEVENLPSNVISASTGDIHETESDPEADFNNTLKRTGSSNSFDTSLLAPANNDPRPKSPNQAQRSATFKSIFGFGPKVRKSEPSVSPRQNKRLSTSSLSKFYEGSKVGEGGFTL